MITYKMMCNLVMFMPVSNTTSWLLQLKAKHHYAEQELGLSQNIRLSTLAVHVHCTIKTLPPFR